MWGLVIFGQCGISASNCRSKLAEIRLSTEVIFSLSTFLGFEVTCVCGVKVEAVSGPRGGAHRSLVCPTRPSLISRDHHHGGTWPSHPRFPHVPVGPEGAGYSWRIIKEGVTCKVTLCITFWSTYKNFESFIRAARSEGRGCYDISIGSDRFTVFRKVTVLDLCLALISPFYVELCWLCRFQNLSVSIFSFFFSHLSCSTHMCSFSCLALYKK